MSLEDIPQTFADAVGINLLSAQVILSIIVIFAMMLPTILLTKEKGTTIHLLVFFLAECLLVGLGWMSFWILIMTVAVLAMAIATLGTGVVTGD